MTRKQTIDNLNAQADALSAGGCTPECSTDLDGLISAAYWLHNDRQTDRCAIAERCFGFSMVLLIIAGFGLPLGITSALFGWAGAAAIGPLTALALLAAAGLLALSVKLVD